MSSELEKFSSQMDSDVLNELRSYARSSNTRIADILSEAVRSYLDQVRVRPAFHEAADAVIEENAELLERLAK